MRVCLCLGVGYVLAGPSEAALKRPMAAVLWLGGGGFGETQADTLVVAARLVMLESELRDGAVIDQLQPRIELAWLLAAADVSLQ